MHPRCRPSAVPEPGPRGTIPIARPYILVVDDDTHVRAALAQALTGAGIAVVPATNGVQALAAVEGTSPPWCCWTTGCRSSMAEGLWAALAQRNLSLPIILMSGDPAVEGLAREVGAVCYLPKPFDLDHLLLLIRRLTDPA